MDSAKCFLAALVVVALALSSCYSFRSGEGESQEALPGGNEPSSLESTTGKGDLGDSLKVWMRPFSKEDAMPSNNTFLRVCSLRKGLGARDYRLYTVRSEGVPEGRPADTTTISLFYRLIAGRDTLREASCSLPGSLATARKVLQRIKHGGKSLAWRQDVYYGREARVPHEANVVECKRVSRNYRQCRLNETILFAKSDDGLWAFSDVPFIEADTTDYGVAGEGGMVDRPDCASCKLPQSAYTPVDFLREQIEDDPNYLLKM